MRWLGELASHSDELAGRGVAIYAVAADSADDTAKTQAKVRGVTLLRDDDLAATAAWHLRVGDADAPWPATFVVDRAGAIRYRHLRDTAGDWPPYADVAAALAAP